MIELCRGVVQICVRDFHGLIVRERMLGDKLR